MTRPCKPVPPCPKCGRERSVSCGKAQCWPCTYAREKANTKYRVCRYCHRDSNAVTMRPGRNGCYDCHREHAKIRQKTQRKVAYCPVCETREVVRGHDGMCPVCFALANEFDAVAEEAV